MSQRKKQRDQEVPGECLGKLKEKSVSGKGRTVVLRCSGRGVKEDESYEFTIRLGDQKRGLERVSCEEARL